MEPESVTVDVHSAPTRLPKDWSRNRGEIAVREPRKDIRMIKCYAALALVLSLIAAVGCTKARGDQEAVRESIQRHLNGLGSLNMAAMEMNFQQIQINGDHAQADVEFRLRQGAPSAAMRMTYSLERHAGDWIVVRSEPAGGDIAHPPMDETHSGMPLGPVHSGIPTINDFFKPGPPPGTGALPPGHPPVATAEKKTQ